MTNQTPESVIAEVLDEERYYDRDQISNESRAAEIVAALRAADLLREPGDLRLPAGATQQANQEAVDEEQIVATVLAELEEHRSTGDTGGWGTTFHRHGLSNEIHRGVDDCGRRTGKPVYVFDPDYLAEHDEWVVQATLRAAQGAAPRVDSDTQVACAVNHSGGVCPGYPHAAPVQPSSTVDEAALIREAKAEALNDAADDVMAEHNDNGDWWDDMNSVYVKPSDWLRTRAAEYREGSGT